MDLFCFAPPPKLSEYKSFTTPQAHVLFSYIVTCYITTVVRNGGGLPHRFRIPTTQSRTRGGGGGRGERIDPLKLSETLIMVCVIYHHPHWLFVKPFFQTTEVQYTCSYIEFPKISSLHRLFQINKAASSILSWVKFL